MFHLNHSLFLIKYHCRYVQDRLRTPAGRLVTLVNIDTTSIQVDQSQDAFCQMQTYSGERRKGHCLLMSNITDPAGGLVAVTPGPNIACTPRGGDGTSLGVQLALARGQNSGFTRILRGTENIGTAFNFDRGYLFNPPNVNTGTNPTLTDFCRDNDILTLSRVKTGEQCFR